MRKTAPLVIIIVLISIIAFFILNRGSDQESNQQLSSIKGINNISSQTSGYQTQSDNQGEVTIDVTPKNLGIEQEKNIFIVDLNTHSVELDFNFTEIIVLKDDLNNQYSALEWIGGNSGHHLTGNIVFPKINQQASQVELQINGIDGIDRTFKWVLNNMANGKQSKEGYINLSSAELAEMLIQKDFRLIDIHIPEQRHIPGTDAFIPFNQIEKIVEALPNKNEKIVLYCRSGSMSRQVAQELVVRGYTEISHLENGLNEWVAGERETLSIESLQ